MKTKQSMFLCGATALAASMLVAPVAQASTSTANKDVSSWSAATSFFGENANGALYKSTYKAGLDASSKVEIDTWKLTVSKPSGAMVVDQRFGRMATKQAYFTISEKFKGTDWAAAVGPVDTRAALIGTEKVTVGEPGEKYTVKVTYWANCFKQPATGNPKEIPDGFRCKYSDLTSGSGFAQVQMRPANTMSLPGNPTDVFFQTNRISHSKIVKIVQGLVGIPPQ